MNQEKIYKNFKSLVIDAVRSVLPISKDEFKKFLPLFFMFFCISLTYGILRRTKDALVLTAAKGSHIIPFLKFCYVLPMAIVMVGYYAFLSNRYDRDRVFLYTLMPFMVFFLTYAFIIHPNQEALTLDSALNIKFIPLGLAQSFQFWYLSLFYTFSELFGSVVLSLLFWQCANSVCSYDLAKRSYPALALGANLALVVQFRIAKLLNSSVQGYLIMAFVVTIIIYILQKHIMNTFYIPEENEDVNATKESEHITEEIVTNNNDETTGLMYIFNLINPIRIISSIVSSIRKNAKALSESFVLLFESSHLRMIAAIVLFYNIHINLIELVWKDTVAHHFIGKQAIDLYMAEVNSYLGYTSIFLSLFVSGQVERNMGWTFAALVTPLASLVCGCLFFIFILMQDSFSAMIAQNPIMIALVLGAMQNVIAKAAKYTLFDPTKEKAYMPLNKEQRSKGKAAIDVVGARLGKSGGAIICIILQVFVSPVIAELISIFFVLFSVAVILWIFSAISLGKKLLNYETKIKEENQQQTSNA